MIPDCHLSILTCHCELAAIVRPARREPRIRRAFVDANLLKVATAANNLIQVNLGRVTDCDHGLEIW
jgi:hypothetical protein